VERPESPATVEPVESISAVTLVTTDMAAAVAFYDALGLCLLYGRRRGNRGEGKMRPMEIKEKTEIYSEAKKKIKHEENKRELIKTPENLKR